MTIFFMHQLYNVPIHLLSKIFYIQSCDSIYGKYCKSDDQHYQEVVLEQRGVLYINTKLLPSAFLAEVNQQKRENKVDRSRSIGGSYSYSHFYVLRGQSTCG